jgi:two-component system cell cycle sensor histidine kinase/response regulator CckA
VEFRRPSLSERISRGIKYFGIAALAVAAATGLRIALDPILLNHVPFLTFYIAVYLASLWGGTRQGLLATALSCAAGAYFIAEPRSNLYISSFGDVLQLLLFVLAGVTVSLSNGMLRSANSRLADSAAALEHRYRVMNMALATAMSGSWELNLETGWLLWDEASKPLYGLGPGFVPSLPAFYSMIHPEDVDRISADIDNCRRNHVSDLLNTFRTILPDGVHYMECRGQVVYDKSGRPARLIGITSDVTERIRAEEERAKLEGKLLEARRLESVGRLAAGIAHDFNNLLTVINGYAALLSEGLSFNSPLKIHAAQISRAGDRAVDLVSQLLSFSQQQMIRPAVLDLNDLIRAEEIPLQERLGEKSNLVLALEPHLGRVKTDPDQFRRILKDIVANAEESMPKGGTVHIATENSHLAPEAARLVSQDPGCYVRITVTDTGEGMTQEYLDHIFEPFFTVKKLRGVGAGLGLATVYGMVHQNGGWVDVQSKVGHGTYFRIYFPQEPDTGVKDAARR